MHLEVYLTCDGSSGNETLEKRMAILYGEAFRIWKERQRKYGCGNISKRGPAGILVRLDDKLARIDKTLTDKHRQTRSMEFQDETLQDTCLDISNYILMLYLCESGHWPGWPHD